MAVSLAHFPEARVGDHVLVHVGFAINRLEEQEALRVLAHLKEMDELGELGLVTATTSIGTS